MAHETQLIFTLTGGLTAALILGFLTERLRLSPIVGYLLAGIVVGPFTPGVALHAALAGEMAEIGVVLLMFGVGIHFNLRELLAVRKLAVPGAFIQFVVATGCAVLLTRALGWDLRAGVIFGLAISVASTVVLMRVMDNNHLLHSDPGHIAVGWTIVEDLFTVVILVVLPALWGQTAGHGPSLVVALAISLLKIGALVAIVLIVGGRAIPALLGYVHRTSSRELFTLTVLVVALGIAVGAAELFGASMALGAFLAGMVVGQSDLSARAASEALPMRDAFAVLFFVSIGMLFDPSKVLPNAPLIVGTTAIIVVAKPISAFVAARVLRYPATTAAPVAIALGQIGEFSFILAALGRELGVLPPHSMQALVAASIVSITLSPLYFRLAAPLGRWLQ
jgi:CPA2 family monovalent cation:H+ antiporter-2